MYLRVHLTIDVTFIYVPIRPHKRDPEAEEIEDAEN